MPTSASRLLSLLSLLQARRDWPGAVLADRLEISRRTVRRDVDRLREMGYPIAAVKGPDGGYRLEAGSELPPLLFDDDQAVALAVALQIATTAGAGIEEAAIRALSTVRQVMPARLRARIDALEVTPVAPSTSRPGPTVDSESLIAIGAAIHAHEVLRFDYESAAGETSGALPRQAEPHHLITWGGRWYLVAWDLRQEDWRTFRVDRIGPREGIVEELGPDRCRLILGSWSWVAMAAAIGRFDADIEVVGPPELAEAFGLLARRYGSAADLRH